MREAGVRTGSGRRHAAVRGWGQRRRHLGWWRGGEAPKAGVRRTSGSQIELRKAVTVSPGSDADVGEQRLSDGGSGELFTGHQVVRSAVKVT